LQLEFLANGALHHFQQMQLNSTLKKQQLKKGLVKLYVKDQYFLVQKAKSILFMV
jgi:hypothetical protein